MPSINRKNKDKLFTYIFGKEQNKQWILDLYNAINGSSYVNPDDIEINTMSDVLYMGMINDVSFIVQGILSLYAHQSTFNPNMPLRELMYAASLYDKYVHQHNLNIYSSKQIKIPVPRIVVFYNGMRNIEDEIILELKDAFPEGSDPDRSDIQVRVRMLNINYGHNKALLSKCRPLMEYSWFVERVRINRDKGMSIEKAVDKTLDDMPADYLIKPFLIGNRAEVTNMCLTEYNEEETMEMLKAEYREEGLEEGRAIGLAEGREIGVKATIRACKIANLSFSDAVESVIYGMDLSQKEAEDLVRKYW